MMMSAWINSCSAKSVSSNGKISDTVGIVALPDEVEEVLPLLEIKRACKGRCHDSVCYFEVNIEYKNKRFYVQSLQSKCA